MIDSACYPAALLLATTLLVPSVHATQNDDDKVELRTVIGCLTARGDGWMLDSATTGEVTEQAFTTQDELDQSRERPLGSLTYSLLGVGEFGTEDHVGHRVQVKGLRLLRDGEFRINVTSLQSLAPECP